MLILAVDLSSDVAGAALLDGHRTVAEETWPPSRRGGEPLFAAWSRLLQRANITPSRIALYACGRGPGTYAGIRTGLAAIRAAALPGGAPVIAVSSGEALAADFMRQADLDRVVVVGDARRDSLWWGAFHREGDRAIPDGDWHTTTPADLPGTLPPHVPLVSPQWPRLQQILDPTLLSSLPWIRNPHYPSAATIGRIAYHHHQAGIPSEPLTPLYLHPAVRPA